MGNYGSRPLDSADDSEKQVTSIKCHYELLCVDPSATPDELKKSYRQQALIHHPDKNPHRQAEATAYFSQLQKAYEVLSDPQERAWYDRNRDAILGRARQKKKHTSGNAPTLDDLMAYFNTNVYSGFGDDPKGFFSVYRRLFEIIEEFEQDHLDLHDEEYDPDEHTSFGTRTTAVEPSLIRFYDKWLSFTSNRPFIEIEAYDTEYADNRRMRRAMEKENEKKRESLRREFSEAVRSLAAFIRKRDPRWKMYQAEKQAERERAEAIRKNTVKASRRADIEGFVEPDWAKKDLDDLQSAAKEFFQDTAYPYDDTDEESGFSNDETDEGVIEDDYDEIYCDPCKKSFKNKAQWKNHEQSKKHQDVLRKMGIKTKHYYGETDEEPEDDMDDELDSETDVSSSSESEPASSVESSDVEDISAEEGAEEDLPIDDAEGLDSLLERIRLEESGRSRQPSSEQKPPTNKKAQKKAAKQASNAVSGPAETSYKCTVCKSSFTSRNQLFKHVKEKGHALAPSSGGRSKGKR